MKEHRQRITDSRAQRQQMERQLVISAVVLFLIAGAVLIGFIYGWEAVLTGLLCMMPGLISLVVLWLLLRLLERLTDRWK